MESLSLKMFITEER